MLNNKYDIIYISYLWQDVLEKEEQGGEDEKQDEQGEEGEEEKDKKGDIMPRKRFLLSAIR